MNGIRYWRLKRRMTYTALAQETGCSSTTLHSWETNPDHITSTRMAIGAGGGSISLSVYPAQ